MGKLGSGATNFVGLSFRWYAWHSNSKSRYVFGIAWAFMRGKLFIGNKNYPFSYGSIPHFKPEMGPGRAKCAENGLLGNWRCWFWVSSWAHFCVLKLLLLMSDYQAVSGVLKTIWDLDVEGYSFSWEKIVPATATRGNQRRNLGAKVYNSNMLAFHGTWRKTESKMFW